MPDIRGAFLLGGPNRSIPLAAAAPRRPAPPTSEVGYATYGSASSGWWDEAEATPELQWPSCLDIYDRMRKQDAQVKSVLRAVTLPVRRTPWRVDPNGARDEVVARTADDFGLPIAGDGGGDRKQPRRRGRFSWSQHLQWALLQVVYGHMPFESEYRLDAAGTTRLRKLGPRWPRTIQKWEVAPDGGLVAIHQRPLAGGDPIKIEVSRLVVYAHEREGDWLGQSLLRPAYKFWLLKDRALRIQGQVLDRNGLGVPVYIGPEGASPTDVTKGAALAQGYRSGDNSGLGIPYGAMFKLLGVEGELPNADVPIRYYDEQIARAVLAHFLNLGTQTGSWALGTTFADFFTLSLQSLANDVADVASMHVVEDLVDANEGPDEPAPRIVHDEIGSRQAATAEAIKALVDAGVIFPDRVLEEAVRQLLGLPPKQPLPEPTGADA